MTLLVSMSRTAKRMACTKAETTGQPSQDKPLTAVNSPNRYVAPQATNESLKPLATSVMSMGSISEIPYIKNGSGEPKGSFAARRSPLPPMIRVSQFYHGYSDATKHPNWMHYYNPKTSRLWGLLVVYRRRLERVQRFRWLLDKQRQDLGQPLASRVARGGTPPRHQRSHRRKRRLS